MGDSSSSDGEGWLGAIEGGVFEEGEDERNRLEAAAAFVEKRREKGWRLTHDELYDEVRGRRVLELGCGIGLPGIASVIMGAREAILTDMEEALPAIDRSVALNLGARGKAHREVLLWGDLEAALMMGNRLGPGGVVLCSDLLYGDWSVASALATTLWGVCGGHHGWGGGGDGKGGQRGGEAGKNVPWGEAGEDMEGVGGGRGGGSSRGRTASGCESCEPLGERSRVRGGGRSGGGGGGGGGSGGCDRGGVSVVLSCHERRWAGDGGKYFFDSLKEMGFTCDVMDPAVLDEQYRDDRIVLTRIVPPCWGRQGLEQEQEQGQGQGQG